MKGEGEVSLEKKERKKRAVDSFFFTLSYSSLPRAPLFFTCFLTLFWPQVRALFCLLCRPRTSEDQSHAVQLLQTTAQKFFNGGRAVDAPRLDLFCLFRRARRDLNHVRASPHSSEWSNRFFEMASQGRNSARNTLVVDFASVGYKIHGLFSCFPPVPFFVFAN